MTTPSLVSDAARPDSSRNPDNGGRLSGACVGRPEGLVDLFYLLTGAWSITLAAPSRL